MRRGLSLACLVALCGAIPAGSQAAESRFQPDVAAKVDALGQQFDLLLLQAGKPAERFERARTLRQGIAALADLDPRDQSDALLTWLAVISMVEGAVSALDTPPAEWERDLLGLYRGLDGQEAKLELGLIAIEIMALQKREAAAPLLAFARQLADLPAYARRGIRWLGRRRLAAGKVDPELRRDLLVSLVEVGRREADWELVLGNARALGGLEPEAGRAATFEAEALFELGRLKEGEAALQRAVGLRAPAGLLARARQRRELAAARQARAGAPSAAAHLGVARALIQLGEKDRIRKTLSSEQVIRAASAELDEIYIDALLSARFDFRAAWEFGLHAKGQPARPGLLGRRIGAGLAVLLGEIFKPGVSRVDPAVLARLEADLEAFRRSDPRLADLTRIHLDFMTAAAGGNMFDIARRMAPRVEAYCKARPDDEACLQMAYLLGQVAGAGPDPWEAVQRYARACEERKTALPERFYALQSGAAVRRMLQRGGAAELERASKSIRARLESGGRAQLVLWQGNLDAARAMLAEGESQAKHLQAALTAYQRVMQRWDHDSEPLQVFCDASSSTATLLAQSGAGEAARELLDETLQICAQDPDALAVSLAVDLAAGRRIEGIDRSPAELLAEILPFLTSRQARAQAQMWIAEQHRAEGRADEEAKGLRQAAAILAEDPQPNLPVLLAPDRRSALALAGQFQMGVGYAPGSPFGLAVEIQVEARMTLFPVSPVTRARIEPYLAGKAGRGGQSPP
ncbi:MAG: hypothetical protein JXR96_06505 [Deltaproteobacteria bacterium]|nr:hypothetical protein [Deltaproteobacteria bacterium]